MENSSIRRQWLDSYQSHLLEEEHSPQTIRKYIHDIAFFFSFLPAEAEISKEKVLAYKQELIQKYRPASANSMLWPCTAFSAISDSRSAVSDYLNCSAEASAVQRRT